MLSLPGWGSLIVSSDIHGNLEDFEALRAIFLARRAHSEDVHWIQLGDIVHAPDDDARKDNPELYDFPDDSPAVIDGWLQLADAHSEHLHFLLGNHEHAHIGGPRTSKFHADEAAYLEAKLDAATKERMLGLFNSAPLLCIAPCGLVFCHGAPNAALTSCDQLIGIRYDGVDNREDQQAILQSCLTSYGQSAEVCARVLAGLSECSGFSLSLLVHGHDRDVAGWFAEGGNQLCPVIFGAPRAAKRYLELDLGARYDGLDAIREGIELRLLY